MMDEVRLTTGQMARMQDGVVSVVEAAAKERDPVPHHYKMTVQHPSGSLCDVRAAEHGACMLFLAQLERLGYAMRNMVRMPGAAPL
jgi:recombinational DNA repair protein (RecF pathway)